MNPEDNRGGAVRLHQPGDCQQQSRGPGVLLPQIREKDAERPPRLSPLLAEKHHSLWGCEESQGLACLCGSSVGTNSWSGAGGWLSCGDALHPRAGQFQQVISVLWASIPLPGAPGCHTLKSSLPGTASMWAHSHACSGLSPAALTDTGPH